MINTDIYAQHAAAQGIDPMQARADANTFNRVYLKLLELDYRRAEIHAPGILENSADVIRKIEMFRANQEAER